MTDKDKAISIALILLIITMINWEYTMLILLVWFLGWLFSDVGHYRGY